MKLADNKYELVPSGEQVMTLESIVARPKSKPTVIEAVFKHENGGIIKNTYKLTVDPKTKEIELEQKSLIPFSCLARCVLGTISDFSLKQDLPKLPGHRILCEITHTEPNEKGYVFANVRKTIKLVDEDDLDEDVDDDLDGGEDDL